MCAAYRSRSTRHSGDTVRDWEMGSLSFLPKIMTAYQPRWVRPLRLICHNCCCDGQSGSVAGRFASPCGFAATAAEMQFSRAREKNFKTFVIVHVRTWRGNPHDLVRLRAITNRCTPFRQSPARTDMNRRFFVPRSGITARRGCFCIITYIIIFINFAAEQKSAI